MYSTIGYHEHAKQLIGRNASGHLTHSKKCLHYIQVIQSREEPSEIGARLIETFTDSTGTDKRQYFNAAESNGKSYTYFVRGVFHPVIELLFDSIEDFNLKTSFMTKVWSLLTLTILLIVITKNLLCCFC
jgi:hypothetical protein